MIIYWENPRETMIKVNQAIKEIMKEVDKKLTNRINSFLIHK